MEQWICRKEQEIKARVNMPTRELQKTDDEIYDQVEAKLKPARENLLS